MNEYIKERQTKGSNRQQNKCVIITINRMVINQSALAINTSMVVAMMFFFGQSWSRRKVCDIAERHPRCQDQWKCHRRSSSCSIARRSIRRRFIATIIIDSSSSSSASSSIISINMKAAVAWALSHPSANSPSPLTRPRPIGKRVQNINLRGTWACFF